MENARNYYYQQLNKEQQRAYYAIREGLWKVQVCHDSEHFWYRENKISWTTVEEVQKRTKQAVKKGKTLLFHWRGGHLTKEIMAELMGIFDKEAKEKDKKAYISVNWSQAVIRVRFEQDLCEQAFQIEEANEEEKL